ncbi:MAG: transposase zinc-binding domain-containing protein [Proteobacteria bacterium]|nr:transposase zinc-binding domain-containing protein [Pseudomonadota bacterium]
MEGSQCFGRKLGILQYGFLRLECSGCGRERVVGFSCKCWGFCNSCEAKRMEQTALRVEKEVWREGVGARQYVLTFRHQVRHWLARSSELLSAVSSEVATEISTFYEFDASLGVPRASMGGRVLP